MSSLIDPDDFIITRKRKKYKFAKFANAANCFEFEDWLQSKPEVFSKNTNLSVELGAGTGLFSVELAKRHPQKTYLAIDVKADRLQKGAYQAIEAAVDNVYFLRARADQIDELFEPKSLQTIWLTFPDPFPKQRSERRRLTHAHFLAKYQQLLRDTGALCLKHDNRDFFCWSLEQLVEQKWRIDELSFDLHESDFADDYKIKTTYEQRWLSEGRIVSLVRASHD